MTRLKRRAGTGPGLYVLIGGRVCRVVLSKTSEKALVRPGAVKCQNLSACSAPPQETAPPRRRSAQPAAFGAFGRKEYAPGSRYRRPSHRRRNAGRIRSGSMSPRKSSLTRDAPASWRSSSRKVVASSDQVSTTMLERLRARAGRPSRPNARKTEGQASPYPRMNAAQL